MNTIFRNTRKGQLRQKRIPRSNVANRFFKISICFVLFLAVFFVSSDLLAQSEPGSVVVVQIKFKPGSSGKWKSVFESNIVPAIREAIEKKDWITNFCYFENVVAGQAFDFILILQSSSFSFFDERRPYPHYQVLFRRLGRENGGQIVKEMSDLEESVSITIMRSFEWEK
jgi:hypothetical protein